MLDNEPAEEAGGRTVGEREARQHAQQGRMCSRGAKCLRQELAHVGPENGTAVDKDGHEDKGFVLGWVLEPGTDRALPGVETAHEQRVGRVRPVGVRVEAAGDEDLARPLGQARRSRDVITRSTSRV